MADQTVEMKPAAGIGRNEPLRLAGTVLLIVLWAMDLLVHHSHVQKVLGFVLVAVLVRVAVTDLEERRIKNRLTVPAAAVAVLIGLVLHISGLPGQVLAGFAAGAFLMFFALLSRGGLGMGDVKLGFVLGIYLSKYVIVALLVGLLASGLFSLGVLVSRGVAAGRKTAIPLGPFLALGGVAAVLAGPWLLSAT